MFWKLLLIEETLGCLVAFQLVEENGKQLQIKVIVPQSHIIGINSISLFVFLSNTVDGCWVE